MGIRLRQGYGGQSRQPASSTIGGSASEVEKTVVQPDSIAPGQPPRKIYMRRYVDAVLQTEMLLRVAVEEFADELIIVTLYKTSKFKKYEPGTQP